VNRNTKRCGVRPHSNTPCGRPSCVGCLRCSFWDKPCRGFASGLDGSATPVQALRPATAADPILPDLGRNAAEPAAAPIKTRNFIGWGEVAVYAYSAIALALLAHFVTGTLLARKLLARANPAPCGGGKACLESELVRIPRTVGWLRPRILCRSSRGNGAVKVGRGAGS
jgi:hypothetical protein